MTGKLGDVASCGLRGVDMCRVVFGVAEGVCVLSLTTKRNIMLIVC